MKIEIGTYTKQDSQGIYSIELNTQKGELSHLQLEVEIDSPTYIAKHDHWMAAVVKDGASGGIALIRDHVVVDQVVSAGAPPCYVSFDGDRVYSANYHKGRIEAYRYTSGKLEFLDAIQYGEGAKGHFVQVDPTTKEIYVCDLGSDRIGVYKFNQGFEEVALIDVAKGSGPRHIAFHPTLPLFYVFTELSNEVLVVNKDTREIVQVISSLASEDEAKSGAAIRISLDGRFLYVSNRGTNTITTFAVTAGQLERIDIISTFGEHPRDFNLVDHDRYVIAANMVTNDLVLYSRDLESGKLSVIQQGIKAFEPVCIIE